MVWMQVWVRQTVVENDLNLFKELPTHLRAQVAWRSNEKIMSELKTFSVSSAVTFLICNALLHLGLGSG